MTKYHIVGIFNFLFGVMQSLYSLATLFITIPKLTELYSEVNAIDVSKTPAYIGLTLVFMIGILNLFIAWRLFLKLNLKKERDLKIGVGLLILSFLFSGMATYLVSFSVINPIYNLSTSL